MEAKQETKRVLLPTDVKPKKYHLTLLPNLPEGSAAPAESTFSGQVIVDVEVEKSVSQVTIHSKEIKISTVTFKGSNKSLTATKIEFNTELETVTFTFSEALPTGTGVFTITFEGILNDQMAGFYRSKYSIDGQPAWLATTQFEPTDARRAFPCWDEPAIKAVFSVTLNVPESLDCLSNMPQTSSKPHASVPGLKSVSFADTPIMSTYLLAFVVGRFSHISATTSYGIQIRVFTPLHKESHGTFALNVATSILSYFSDFFSVGFPLPKLDLIAIPDFAAGAMENWGLITFRETALLVDPNSPSVSVKQRVAYVVSHELAHMWFGNLVTMEWWKELWLNEGFATYVGNMAVDHLHKEWDMWTKFVTDHVARAWDLDSLKTSHAIEVEVASSAQVNEIFDAISYSKGASIVRQVYEYVGEQNFRKGMAIYLNRFHYKNAKTVDLWDALGEASGLDVKNFMANWTRVTGYPVLNIKKGSKDDELVVSQEIFLSSGEKVAESPLWWINVGFIASGSKEVVKVDVKERSQTINIKLAGKNKWLKANASLTGFYRVNYEESLFKQLVSHLQELSTIDRLGLQNDAFAMAKAGRMGTVQVLELVREYAKTEKDCTIWTDLANNLSDVGVVFGSHANPQVNLGWTNFIQQTFGRLGQQYGWDKKTGETDLESLLRPIVLGRLGGTGDKAIIAESQKRFEEYYQHVKGSSNSEGTEAKKETLAGDLRATVYALVMRNGGVAEWNKIRELYNTSADQSEKVRCLRALGSGSTKEMLEKALDWSLSGEVRNQDIFILFGATASSGKVGRETTWEFLKSQMARIEGVFGKGSFLLLARIISLTIGNFSDEGRAAEIEEWFRKNPVEPAKRAIEQGLEAIRLQARWLKRDEAAVSQWLLQFAPAENAEKAH